MSYYTVNGYKVLGWQRAPHKAGTFDEVDIPFMSSLSAHEQISIIILSLDNKPNANFLKREELRNNYLKEQYANLSKDEFVRRFVEFNFKGDEAKGFACLIIDDFFRINKNGFLTRKPGIDRGSREHYEKTDFNPWDEYIYINVECIGRQKKNWWNSKLEPFILSFQMNLLEVESIVGTLDKFILTTSTHKLRFSWSVIIEAIE